MRRLGLDDLVDDSVVDGLLGRHEEIPVAVRLDLVLGLVAVFGNVGVEDLPDEQNLLGLDLDIGGLSLGSSQRLVDHDAGVGQRPSLALGAGTQQKGTHRGGHSEADGGNITGDVLHGVVDGHTGRDGSTGAVDVEGNILFRVLVGQVQELGDQDVGDLVVDALSQQEDSVLEQSRQDVHLTARGVDDGHSHGVGGGCLVGVSATGVDLHNAIQFNLIFINTIQPFVSKFVRRQYNPFIHSSIELYVCMYHWETSIHPHKF